MFFWFIWLFRCSQIIILIIITSSHLAVEPWHPKLATAWKNVLCDDRNGCPETDSITVTWGKMMEKTLSKLRTDLEGGAIAATCWDPVLSRTSHETARNYMESSPLPILKLGRSCLHARRKASLSGGAHQFAKAHKDTTHSFAGIIHVHLQYFGAIVS